MNIGNAPTLSMIQDYVGKKRFGCRAVDIYVHYKKRNWRKKNGQPLYSVEAMCNAYNGVWVQRFVRKDKTKKGNLWGEKFFACFKARQSLFASPP